MKYFKTFVVFVVFLTTLFASETSDAGDDGSYYFKGEIGKGFPNDPSQVSGAGTSAQNESNDKFRKYGIGFGINPDGPARADFSFSHSPNMKTTSNGSFNTTARGNIDNYLVMMNIYYDFEEGEQSFVPYFSGGIGLSRMVTDNAKVTNAAGTINVSEGGETKNNLGWALGLGAAINMKENVSLDMGYRFLAMGKAEQSGVFSGTPAQASNSGARMDNLFAHELYLGLRIGF
ncbi:outer membrane beta-barrel protein [Rhodospirillales bacterium]|nr:outer membrane beta-barrel protein [Rhodospirillales bacterium]